MKWRFMNDRTEAPWRDDPYDSLMEARSDAYRLEWWRDEMIEWQKNDANFGSVLCTPILEAFVAETVQHIKSKDDPMYSNWADMAMANASAVTAARMVSQCVMELDREIGPFLKAVFRQHCEDAQGVL